MTEDLLFFFLSYKTERNPNMLASYKKKKSYVKHIKLQEKELQ